MRNINWKKIILTLTSIFLLSIGYASLTFAADLSKDVFIIDDQVFTNLSQNSSGNGWSWNASKNTLTIDGYNGGPIMYTLNQKSTKPFKLVVKNNNTINYDTDERMCPALKPNQSCENSSGYKCAFCQRQNGGFGGILTKNCQLQISGGGTIKIKSNGTNTIYADDALIQNVTITSDSSSDGGNFNNLIMKNCTWNIDAVRAIGNKNATFENCTISYKNTRPTHHDHWASGGNTTFKNCTMNITMGAIPLDSESMYGSFFVGNAQYIFDNTTVNIKGGPHNNLENSQGLCDVGYPALYHSSITIKNNSKFFLNANIDSAFSAFKINISDSSINGVCSGRLIAAIICDITNSKIDVTCPNEMEAGCVFVVQKLNIKNSKIKVKTPCDMWGKAIEDPDYEKGFTLVDTELELEGKVGKFFDSRKLNYTTPEKWLVYLDGVQSKLSVNSPELSLLHKKIVIKVNENYVPSPSKPTTPGGTNSTQVGNQNSGNDTSSTDQNNESNDANLESSDNNQELSNQSHDKDKSKETVKTEKNKNKTPLPIIIVIVSVIAVGAGIVTAVFIYKKKKEMLNQD